MEINYLRLRYKMFNGIIFHTGKIKSIKRGKDSIYISIKSSLNLKKKILDHRLVVMVCV